MYVAHSDDIPAQVVSDEGAEKTTVRWLIAEREGARTFAMRLFEVQPGGQTPFHAHAWEHEVFVLEGNGELAGADKTWQLRAGDVVFVPPLEQHAFRNTGDGPLRFLCCIPLGSS